MDFRAVGLLLSRCVNQASFPTFVFCRMFLFPESGAMSGDLRMIRNLSFVMAMTCVFSGCGEGVIEPNWPDAVACAGTVTMDGKPLSGVRVLFIPDVSTNGQGGSGTTDDAGKFAASSRNTKGEVTNGIIPGKYRVAFSRMVKSDGSVWIPDPTSPTGPATVGAREEIPLKYSDPARSLMLIEVKAGGPDQEFALKKN
jgi:hypothetical protein